MGQTTTFITVSPIINVGVVSEGNFCLLPFYQVELHTPVYRKRLFVNYTFGAVKNGRMEYETATGWAKEGLMHHLLPRRDVTLAVVQGTKLDEMVAAIKEALGRAPDDARLLFVWERRHNDDKPFFQAMQIEVDNGKPKRPNLPAPKTASELGLMVEPPYQEVPLDRVISAPVVQGMPK